MGAVLGLLVLVGLVFRIMTLPERTRFAQGVFAAILKLKDAATRLRPELEVFRGALRARTPHVLVTPTLVVLNALVFVSMLSGTGASSAETLTGWGGNFGPRTTNGEWWRLVTTMFVHTGIIHLFVNIVALAQLGLVLERLIGGVTFGSVYIVAGIFASLTSLSTDPMAVNVGGSGGVFGLYGLLLASSIWSMLHRSSVTIPLRSLTRLSPAAAVFILYNLVNHGLGLAAELTGFLAGFVCGLVLTMRVSNGKPPVRRVAVVMALTGIMAMASALPLRGITDARPELERVVAVEDRTATTYKVATDGFKHGRITAEALARLIEETIVPELRAADARLRALEGVPQEHQPLIADAEEYLRLRSESWRLRADGLRKTHQLIQNAGRTDRASVASTRVQIEGQFRANAVTLGKAEGRSALPLKLYRGSSPSISTDSRGRIRRSPGPRTWEGFLGC